MAQAEGDSSELQLNYHVRLVPNPLRFTPRLGTVHFDRCNRQIVVTRDKEVRRIPLRKDTDDVRISSISLSFNVESKCTKFSLDHQYLAIQQKSTEVRFINLESHTMFTHKCKRPNSPILGFFWTCADNVFFVTTTGLELYQYSRSRNLKLVREHKLSVNWFVYSSKLRLLLLSTGPTGGEMHGYYFKPSTIVKIPKFVIDPTPQRIVDVNDVSIHQIYDRVYCVHANSSAMELGLYLMTREVVTKVAGINLHTNGRVAVHIVDNILVAHNLEHKITLLFDYKEPDHFVAAPLPLTPFAVLDGEEIRVEPYSKSWEFVSPRFILDRQQGFVYEVAIDLEAIALTFPDKIRLIDFLLRRTGSKDLLLRVLRMVIEEGVTLSTLASIFDKLNSILQSVPAEDNSEPSQTSQGDISSTDTSYEYGQHERALPSTPDRRTPQGFVVVAQKDMYSSVLLALDEEQHERMDQKYFVAVTIEYIRSLSFHHVEVQHFLYELVIHSLVRNNRFYQLHQFLQYHVVADSIPVACQLLSLESKYPPAQQLALDMLKRLTSPGRIVEVLLSRDQLLTALRVLKCNRGLKVPVERFLEAASHPSQSDILFYTVYKFFQGRGDLPPSCAKYTEAFLSRFPSERNAVPPSPTHTPQRQ